MIRRRFGQTVAGALVIALGVLILGLQANWWPVTAFRTVGPILMVIVGATMLLMGRGRGEPGAAIALSGGGTILLLHFTGVLPLSTSWPLFIVVAGLMVLIGHRRAGSCTGKGNHHAA
jgi:hypothetical protein